MHPLPESDYAKLLTYRFRDDGRVVRLCGFGSLSQLTPLHSLPIQLYLVDAFTFAASAISAAAVCQLFLLRRCSLKMSPWAVFPFPVWIWVPSLWTANVRQPWPWWWQFGVFISSLSGTVILTDIF